MLPLDFNFCVKTDDCLAVTGRHFDGLPRPSAEGVAQSTRHARTQEPVFVAVSPRRHAASFRRGRRHHSRTQRTQGLKI